MAAIQPQNRTWRNRGRTAREQLSAASVVGRRQPSADIGLCSLVSWLAGADSITVAQLPYNSGTFITAIKIHSNGQSNTESNTRQCRPALTIVHDSIPNQRHSVRRTFLGSMAIRSGTEPGGSSPRARARSHRCKREIPIQGPYLPSKSKFLNCSTAASSVAVSTVLVTVGHTTKSATMTLTSPS